MRTSKFQAPTSRETPSSKIQSGRPLAFFLTVMASFPLFVQAAGPGIANAIPPLRPPHAEIPLTFWEHYDWVIIAAGLGLAGLVGIIAWRLTRPQPPVVIPPEEQARLALNALPASATDGATLSRISQILRHYLRRTFELPTVELTTTEFCQVLAAHPQIGVGLSLALMEFLRDNDLRKFSPDGAAQPPANAVTQALTLVDKCEARRADLRDALAATATRNHKPA